MTDPPPHLSPSCCYQTVWGFCSLCLDPVWVHRNLMERTRHNAAAVIDLSSVWWWHHLHPQWDVNEWCHSLKFALFSWIKWKTHLHFLRPGVNHRSPAGCRLKGGGGSEQHILFQHAIMDMTSLYKKSAISFPCSSDPDHTEVHCCCKAIHLSICWVPVSYTWQLSTAATFSQSKTGI